ncbi:MAG: DUF2892 domain-containing protein [Gemmatimonadota bacterium]|nr:DUF2892 domain-containing protein [Gemmatimonadota bacterium]
MKNMGTIDRVVRALVAVGIVILYVTGVITGVVAIGLGLVAVVFAATSASGSCPAYRPLGFSTMGKSHGSSD